MAKTDSTLVTAGLLLGIGLGGFLDGIVFHQMLQLHSMLSGVRPRRTLVDADVHMFWDGMFHALTWMTTLAGVVQLWRAGRGATEGWSGRTLAGAMILGWGLFNLVEGLIDHHLLGVHHVVERLGLSVYDWSFLGIGGVALAGVGWWLIASAKDG